MSEIKSTRQWFAETGQIPLDSAPNVRQVTFYIGMQVEELAEKLSAVFGTTDLITRLVGLAHAMKAGDLRTDDHVAAALQDPAAAKELLDGDADLLWVTIGSSAAMACDLDGAYNKGVAKANWEKKFPDGTFHRHEQTGKVLKPEGWQAADLTEFLHPSLR